MADLSALDPYQILADFLPYLRIAHQIPGRVRLKLDAAALDEPLLKQVGFEPLKGALATLRGVRKLQFNLLARSCVVEYDRAILPDAAWPDLLAGRQSAAAGVLKGILTDKYEEFRDGQP